MDAIILAAGLGTRLRPLTDGRPKALVEVCGRTMLELAVRRVVGVGASRVVVNVHHHADMMKAYIGSRQWPCQVIVSNESDMLLDTGGGVRRACGLTDGDGPVLVHNVDVLECIDLESLLRTHMQDGNAATLCVSHRQTRRLLAFDSEGRFRGRATEGNVPSGCEGLAFSGVYMVSRCFVSQMAEADAPYSIIDELIRLSGQGMRVMAYRHPAEQWMDLGTVERLAAAEAEMANTPSRWMAS